MIERHYDRPLDGAGAGIADRLDAFEAEWARAAPWRAFRGEMPLAGEKREADDGPRTRDLWLGKPRRRSRRRMTQDDGSRF
jgi:hypothetical protein